MTEETPGEKREEQPVLGKEKDEAAGAEVAGRARTLLYTCLNDGAGNYIQPDWKWFTCWRCGGLYYI